MPGAPGIDAIYGRGVLDLTRAFQPVGATVDRGQRGGGVDRRATATLSRADGRCARQAALGAVILDGFGRAFAIDLAQTIVARRRRHARSAARCSVDAAHDRGSRGGDTAVVDDAGARPRRRRARRDCGSTSADADSARAIAGSGDAAAGRRHQLRARLRARRRRADRAARGPREPAFLVADDRRPGLRQRRARGSIAVRQQIGRLGRHRRGGERRTCCSPRERLLAGARRLAARTPLRPRQRRRSTGASAPLGARRSPPRRWPSATRCSARGSAPRSARRARRAGSSTPARGCDAGAGWTLGGSLRQGWTRAAAARRRRRRHARAPPPWPADVGKDGVFGARQPRPAHRAAACASRAAASTSRLPTDYDYATLRRHRLDHAAPQPRPARAASSTSSSAMRAPLRRRRSADQPLLAPRPRQRRRPARRLRRGAAVRLGF